MLNNGNFFSGWRIRSGHQQLGSCTGVICLVLGDAHPLPSTACHLATEHLAARPTAGVSSGAVWPNRAQTASVGASFAGQQRRARSVACPSTSARSERLAGWASRASGPTRTYSSRLHDSWRVTAEQAVAPISFWSRVPSAYQRNSQNSTGDGSYAQPAAEEVEPGHSGGSLWQRSRELCFRLGSAHRVVLQIRLIRTQEDPICEERLVSASFAGPSV